MLIGIAVGRHRRRRPGRPPGVRAARPLRGAVRRHLGLQQQRQRLRRAHLRHAVLEHAAGRLHALRPVPADGRSCWPWPDGSPPASSCRASAGTLPTHRPLFVGPPHRRRPRRRRSDLRARARSSVRSWSPCRERQHPAPLDAPSAPAARGAPRRPPQAGPARARSVTPVMLVVEVGAVATTVHVGPRPEHPRLVSSPSGSGSPCSSAPWPSPWPRAAARPRPPACARSSRRRRRARCAAAPTSSVHRQPGRAADRRGRRAPPARRRRRRRRGRRADPRRRRRHRGRRLGRRVGGHRRVRAGDPRVRRRPQRRHRRHRGALRPDRRPDHLRARASPSWTG